MNSRYTLPDQCVKLLIRMQFFQQLHRHLRLFAFGGYRNAGHLFSLLSFCNIPIVHLIREKSIHPLRMFAIQSRNITTIHGPDRCIRLTRLFICQHHLKSCHPFIIQGSQYSRIQNAIYIPLMQYIQRLPELRCLKPADHSPATLPVCHCIGNCLQCSDLLILFIIQIPQRIPCTVVRDQRRILISSVRFCRIQILLHAVKVCHLRQIPFLQQICPVEKSSTGVADGIFVKLWNAIQTTVPLKIRQIILPIGLIMCKQLRYHVPISIQI